MANPHICNDKCFELNKLRIKFELFCFICNKKSNPRCFNINKQIKENDNTVFLCFKCIIRIKETFKNQNRKSNTRNSILTQPHSSKNTVINGNIKDTRIDEILHKLNKLNDKFNNTSENSIYDTMNNKLVNLMSTIDNTFSLLTKVDSKIDSVATINEIKNANKNICDVFSEKIDVLSENLNSASANELFTHNSLIDWSMKADNSIHNDLRRLSVAQNCSIGDNILDVIKNHEKSTWESIDNLNKNIINIGNELNGKINLNTSQLNSIYEIDESIATRMTSLHEILEPVVLITKNYHLNLNSIESTSRGYNINKSNEDSSTMDKQCKEAMTQSKKSKNVMQKRQMPNLSGVELIACNNHQDLNDDNTSSILNSTQQLETMFFHATNTCAADSHESRDIYINTTNNFQSNTHNNQHSSFSSVVQSSNSGNNTNYCSLYLSRLQINTTAEDIFNYIKANGIHDTSDIQLFKLIKMNANISNYTFISYKIETTTDIAAILISKDFWPSNCIIKEFISKARRPKIASLRDIQSKSTENFPINHQNQKET